MSGTNYIASNWRTPENSNSSKNDNYSLDFNGSSDFISCGDDPQIQLTGDISISAWFKTSSTGTMIMVAKRDSPLGGNSLGWQVYCTGGNIAFTVTRSGPTTTTAVGGTNIADGEWHHVLCTVNQDSQIAIILDGSTEGTASLPAGTFTDSGSNLRIGYNQVGAAHYYFNGEISEVALFDYLVSGATLYGDATSGAGNPMALKPTPVGYWPLGDNSASDPLAQPNVAVENASVFSFDGINDFVNAGSSIPNLKTGDISFSAWVYPTSFSSYNYFLDSGAITTKKGIFAGLQITTGFVAVVRQTGVTDTRCNTGWVDCGLTINNWYNIVGVFDEDGGTAGVGQLKLYVNGVLKATVDGSGQDTGTGYDLHIGKSENDFSHFVGNIDEVSLYNSPLTSENVTSIYNSGVPNDISSLNPTAWYKLDESANWEADTVGAWQIPDAVSEFPQSFDFDGTNDEINAGDILHNDGQTPMTVSAWVNVSTDGDYPIAGKKKVRSAPLYAMNGWDVTLDTAGISKNKLTFQLIGVSSGGVGIGVIAAKANGFDFNDGLWHHVVVTYDGSEDASGVKFYRDGAEDTNVQILSNTFSGNSVNDPSVDFKIGTAPKYSGSNFYNGELSNVQVWDVALTGEKIITLYNGGTPTLTPPNQSDLKGWYKLDNTELFDGNNWSLQNQVYPANYESALDFDQSIQARINLSTDVDLGINSTISAWYKWDGTPALNDIFIGLDFSYVLYFSDPNTIIARIGSVFKTFSFTTLANVWYNLVMVRTGDSIELFINNISIGTQTGYGTATNTTFDSIGARASGAFPFNGLISNVAGFNSSLDSSQIETIYNNGTPETSISSSPISWWKLDNLTTGIQDSVGSNDGTNNGATKINTFVSNEASASTGMTEQSLVNNNVSTLNGESSGMTSGNLVLSDLTRNLPYENYSLSFDSGIDYVECGNISGLNGGLTEATWSGWFNRSSSGGFYIMGTYGVGQIQFFVFQGNNYVTAYAGNSIGAQRTMAKANVTAWTTNQWYHLTFVYNESESSDANKMKIYIDGVLQANVVAGAALTNLNSSTANFDIGRLTGIASTQFVGKISNVAIWNNGLSSTEVQNLYANGMPQDLTTFTPQPINWWTLGKESFWDGADWVIRDMIGTNDGLSSNMGGSELKGDAPRSQANGVGTNIAVPTDLKGNAGWSDKNGYSINMSSTARTTDTP